MVNPGGNSVGLDEVRKKDFLQLPPIRGKNSTFIENKIGERERTRRETRTEPKKDGNKSMGCFLVTSQRDIKFLCAEKKEKIPTLTKGR